MAAKQTRARFLGTGAAAIGGAALAGAWRVDGAGAATAKTEVTASTTFVEGAFDQRFSGEIFHMELDGKAVGWIKGVSGGVAYADVVTEKLGPDHIAKKHIANLKYEDIAVTVSMGMSKGLYQWIKASFDKSYLRKTGSIVGDSNGLKMKSSGDFQNALITEIGFPALDATSKDAAKMEIKFSPQSVAVVTRTGKAPLPGPGQNIKGTWKLQVDGLDTSRVNKIDSFTIKQAVVQDATGQETFDHLDIPNLSVYLSPDSVQSWVDWFNDFVIKGNNGQAAERGGALIFLDGNSKQLAQFSLNQLGLFKLTPEKVESGSEAIKRIKAEMYCEDISFSFGDATWA